MPTKILTVDDAKTVRLIVRKAMKPFDVTICDAQNGEEGLAVATCELPDLILLDVTMPVMDGVEMLKRLRADPRLHKIPVVMLTAEAGREKVTTILQLGARDYIVKPFTEPVLVEKLSRQLKLRPAGAAADAPRPVLLIEEKPAVVQQIVSSATDAAWIWRVAGTRAEAMELARGEVPAAVVVALSLPDDGAIGLLRAFQSDPRLVAVPFFGLALKTAADERGRATAAGFAGLIDKPINTAELVGKLRALFTSGVAPAAITVIGNQLVVRPAAAIDDAQADALLTAFQTQAANAVDAGCLSVAVDLAAISAFSAALVRCVEGIRKHAAELGLGCVLLGSAVVAAASREFEAAKDWQFQESAELARH